MEIPHLIQHLDLHKPTTLIEVSGWCITPITGGANNLLYHTKGQEGDYAIKFTMKDQHRRAYREYRALSLLQSLNLTLAPRPIFFDEDRYSLPVIVQTWIEGQVGAGAPTTEEAWLKLIDYLAAVHQVTVDKIPTEFTLEKPVLYAETPEQCKAIIRLKLERLPDEAQPPSLRMLVTRFERLQLPQWNPPMLSLVRADPNPRNFVRRTAGMWASVDWEYSGMTDGAFEIADLLAHPEYMTLPPGRQMWVIEQYCARMGNEHCTKRIKTYWLTMTLWWVVRFAQYLYEIPLGLDPRLVQRPPTWKEDTERKYTHYVALTEAMLDN